MKAPNRTSRRPTLLILAAGLGSRYGGLKQLDPIGLHGETIIDYSVFDAARAGFGKVVFVLRREIADAFAALVGSRAAAMIDVDYAFQDTGDLPAGVDPPAGRVKPWGTGHAVLAARHLITEPFAVITADDFYGRRAHETAAAFLGGLDDTGAADYGMVGYRLANTLSEFGGVSRGLCRVGGAGELERVVETLDIRRQAGVIRGTADGREVTLSGEEIVSMTFWAFTPAVFGQLEALFAEFLRERLDEPAAEFYLPSAVNALVAGGRARVAVLDCDATWFGVTYRPDKPRVQRHLLDLIDAGVYPSPLRGDP